MRIFAVLAFIVVASGCLDFGSERVTARDLVDDRTYTKWVIEVDTVQGMGWPSGIDNLLRSRMDSMVSKPGGIQVIIDDTLPATDGSWSAKEIVDYGRAHQDHETGGKTVVTHLLLLDGGYSANQQALGVQITNGPIAIFAEKIRSTATCTPLLNQCSDTRPVWEAVVVHEFGHAIGLVNHGIPMQRDHEDKDHPAHSSNQNSVMFWAVETTGVLDFFTGGPPDTFDADDKADVCAAGGKCS